MREEGIKSCEMRTCVVVKQFVSLSFENRPTK